MKVLVAAVLEAGKVVASVATALVVAVARERAVDVPAVAPAPAAVKDAAVVASRAETVLVVVRVAVVAA